MAAVPSARHAASCAKALKRFSSCAASLATSTSAASPSPSAMAICLPSALPASSRSLLPPPSLLSFPASASPAATWGSSRAIPPQRHCQGSPFLAGVHPGCALGRGFHLSAASLARSAAQDVDLVKALEAEIKHEKTNYSPPEELKEGPPALFKVESNPGAAELVLRRSFEGEDIEVVVSAPEEEPEPTASYDEDTEEGEEGEGEKEDVEPYVPVMVKVTKKTPQGVVQTMEFECVLESFVDEKMPAFTIEAVKLKAPNVPDGSISYTGPDFYTLEGSLQEQFDKYLEQRGLNAELADFIRVAMDDKDQQEYERWLKRVKEFIAA